VEVWVEPLDWGATGKYINVLRNMNKIFTTIPWNFTRMAHDLPMKGSTGLNASATVGPWLKEVVQRRREGRTNWGGNYVGCDR
jgi:hypothetical protein